MRQIPLKNAPPITVHAVVRTIPGQREVVRGAWRGETVYAKIFSGPRASIHAARDVAGVKLLTTHGLATPALLHEDAVAAGTDEVAGRLLSPVVIYAALPDAVNAEVAYAGQATSARNALCAALVKAVALHHKASIYQSDLHLKNFLVTNALGDKAAGISGNEATFCIHTIDGDGIRTLPRFGKVRKMHQNLATFFSKMDVLDTPLIPSLYAVYCAEMDIAYAEKNCLKLLKYIAKIRMTVASAYADKKVFRSCTDVVLNQFSQTHGCAGFYQPTVLSWIARTSVDIAAKINLDTLNGCLVKPTFKAGNTCTVGLLPLAVRQTNTSADQLILTPAQVVVKRYNMKNAWHAMTRSLRITRAALSWANAHRLQLLGLPTAAPIALIEKRYFCNMLKSTSYFVSTYVDAPDVMAFFATEKDPLERADAMREITKLFYQLYLLKISHGDMKASNLKIHHGKPVLIDLDSMQQHQCEWRANKMHVRDLKRFIRNWTEHGQQHAALIAAFKKTFKVVYADPKPLLLAKLA